MDYYDSSKFPYIQNNFISGSECDQIVKYTKDNLDLFDNDTQSVDFWSKRVINYGSIPDPILQQHIIHISRLVGSVLSEITGINPLVPDTLQIVRWMPGYELFPHADKEESNGNPHPFPWRDFASVIYLNDDFEGGEIHWPNKGKEWKPVKGSLALFPGTLEFLHGVRNVPEGVRYTIPSFYTRDLSKAIPAWR